jgi:hypothetical protein
LAAARRLWQLGGGAQREGLQFYILAKKKIFSQQQFISIFIMLLITISPETMVFYLLHGPISYPFHRLPFSHVFGWLLCMK